MSHPQPLFPVDDDAPFGFTPLDLWRVWFKYWPTLLGCFLLVTMLTWGALFLQPAIYESSAKVWVQTEQQGTPSFLSGIAAYRESQVPEQVNRRIETEIQILLSRSNVEAVVARLGIKKSQLIQAPLDYLISLASSVRGSRAAAPSRDDVVELFIKGISVEPLRSKTADTTSNVLEVKFDCTDKALAPRALAALLQEYIQFGAQHNRELGEATYRLVDSKIQEETTELKGLDDQILNLTIAQESRPDVSLRDSGNLSAQVVHTPGGGATLDATSQNVRGLGSSSLNLLKSETIEMQARLEEAQQLYTDDSPNVRHLQDQLHQLRQRLGEGVRTSAKLDAELQRLDRQRALALQRYTELRTKLDQIELYLQVNPTQTDSRLVTETPIQPQKPQRKTKIIVAMLGLLGGLFGGLVLAGLREYLDHRLQSAADVKRYLGIETLGIVPKLKLRT